MQTFRVTAADRQTGREVRLEMEALSESEAAQIVARFALVRRIEPAGTAAACPRCGHAPGDRPAAGTGVIGGGGDAVGGPRALPLGPKTSIGTVPAPLAADRAPGGRRITGQQMLGGAVALAGLPLLVFGLVLSGRPEPEASRGDTMMVTAGVLLAVGLGWLIVASLLAGRRRG